MSLADSVRGYVRLWQAAYCDKRDRVLGRDVWDKIIERRLCYPSEYRAAINILSGRSLEMSPESWHRHVGQVARGCPRSMPRHLRHRWVVRQLAQDRMKADLDGGDLLC